MLPKDGPLQSNKHTVWNGEWRCEQGNEQSGPWTLHLDVRYRGRENRETGEWTLTMERERDIVTLSESEDVVLSRHELKVGSSWVCHDSD